MFPGDSVTISEFRVSSAQKEILYVSKDVTSETSKIVFSGKTEIKAPEVHAGSNAVSIPLKRIGKLYMIEAVIDDETGHLIFDTGASCLVLNETYFRNYVSVGQSNSSGITGDIGTAKRVTANNLSIGALNYKGVLANLANLAHIENRRGIKVLGLFGFELIRQYEIRIDYANNQILLFPVDRKGNLLSEADICNANYFHKIDEVNNVLFMRAIIGGKNLRFCFDTGAETNVLSTSLPKNVLQTVTITRTSKLRGAGSAYTDVIYGRMNDFLFGDTAFTQMETVITYLDHLNESYGTHLDGVVGFDFISKGTFCINFVKKQMGIAYLKPEEL
jgi:predicted aspartyl protease